MHLQGSNTLQRKRNITPVPTYLSARRLPAAMAMGVSSTRPQTSPSAYTCAAPVFWYLSTGMAPFPAPDAAVLSMPLPPLLLVVVVAVARAAGASAFGAPKPVLMSMPMACKLRPAVFGTRPVASSTYNNTKQGASHFTSNTESATTTTTTTTTTLQQSCHV
jgi:hypothetical protein